MSNKIVFNIFDVSEFTGISKPTIYRLMKSGDFPRPMQLSTNRVAWRKSDVMNWLSDLPTAGGY